MEYAESKRSQVVERVSEQLSFSKTNKIDKGRSLKIDNGC